MLNAILNLFGFILLLLIWPFFLTTFDLRNFATETALVAFWMVTLMKAAYIVLNLVVPTTWMPRDKTRERFLYIAIGTGVGGATSVWIVDLLLGPG
jgi:hypothetical protein